jgi:hypothetical protein
MGSQEEGARNFRSLESETRLIVVRIPVRPNPSAPLRIGKQFSVTSRVYATNDDTFLSDSPDFTV